MYAHAEEVQLKYSWHFFGNSEKYIFNENGVKNNIVVLGILVGQEISKVGHSPTLPTHDSVTDEQWKNDEVKFNIYQ